MKTERDSIEALRLQAAEKLNTAPEDNPQKYPVGSEVWVCVMDRVISPPHIKEYIFPCEATVVYNTPDKTCVEIHELKDKYGRNKQWPYAWQAVFDSREKAQAYIDSYKEYRRLEVPMTDEALDEYQLQKTVHRWARHQQDPEYAEVNALRFFHAMPKDEEPEVAIHSGNLVFRTRHIYNETAYFPF